MNTLEQQLLSEATGGKAPRLCLRTRTRIDTGRWWRASPLWLCVMPDEIILLAVDRRRHLERIPLVDCRDSRYNPATGELVIAPADNLRFPCLAMSATEALRILNLIQTSKSNPTPEPANQC